VKPSEFIVYNGEKGHVLRFLDDSRVILDGKEYLIDVKIMSRSQCSLILGNRVYRVDFTKLYNGDFGGEVEVVIKGRTLRFRPQDARTQMLQSVIKARPPRNNEAVIRAPMPGLVGRILASPGTRLGAGAGIMILEAMKMENEIRCPSAATIKEIKVTPGETVDKNQLLATLSLED